MVMEVPSYQFALKILEKNRSLDGFYQQADNYCKTCRTPSPMTCVEECELWRVKNEFLHLNEFVSEKGHLFRLFNAIKNVRRATILNFLAERPQTKTELQKRLKMQKYLHSRSTIEEYMKSLIQTGLVKRESSLYTLTIYGRKIQDAIRKTGTSYLLPTRSQCYEEMVLVSLVKGPKTQDELLGFLPKKSFTRIVKRLQDGGLVSKNERDSYIFYFKVKKGTRRKLTPTERRVFDAIKPTGSSAHDLSRDVSISVRRTYKYLRKLGDKNLVSSKRKPVAYELTSDGVKTAGFLGEITELASSASKALNIMLKQHPNVLEASSRGHD